MDWFEDKDCRKPCLFVSKSKGFCNFSLQPIFGMMTYFRIVIDLIYSGNMLGEGTNFEKQVAATCYTSSGKLERLKSFDITMILLALNIKKHTICIHVFVTMTESFP